MTSYREVLQARIDDAEAEMAGFAQRYATLTNIVEHCQELLRLEAGLTHGNPAPADGLQEELAPTLPEASQSSTAPDPPHEVAEESPSAVTPGEGDGEASFVCSPLPSPDHVGGLTTIPAYQHEEPETEQDEPVIPVPPPAVASLSPSHAEPSPASPEPVISRYIPPEVHSPTPGLTPRQQDVYDYIRDHPGCTSSQVGDVVIMSNSNVATHAKKLEAMNLVRIEGNIASGVARYYYYPVTEAEREEHPGDAGIPVAGEADERSDPGDADDSGAGDGDGSHAGREPDGSPDAAHREEDLQLGGEERKGDGGSLRPDGDTDGPPAPAQATCTCPMYWYRQVQRFDVLVANESHHESCAMYKQGAHFFPVPSAMGDGVDVQCIWCRETKHFAPPGTSLAGQGNLARDPRQANICPKCGGHKSSLLHKQGCAEKTG